MKPGELSSHSAEIVDRYLRGESTRTIGKHFNVGPKSVWCLLRRAGVPCRTNSESLKLAHKNGRYSHRNCLTGPKSPLWRGGRTFHSAGYRMIHKPDHPRSNMRGYVMESVLIAEKAMGRYLNPNEIVHHIDGDKTNNGRSNLVVMTRSYHAQLHNRLRAKTVQDVSGRMPCQGRG